MTPVIRCGQALVLHGGQGVGKSELARALAAKHGRFLEIDSSQLKRDCTGWLDPEVRTYIVHGLPPPEANLDALKSLISSGRITLRKKDRPAEIVETPNFIFLTNAGDAGKCFGNRRFQVHEVNA